MKLKRAIKRIVALGTGATMVGATILGAMAQADYTLADYPQPFIEDGSFNGLIVVGAEAKTEDVLGSIDIATSLQYSATVKKAVPGTGTTIDVEGEGVKIETDSNEVAIGDSLQSIKSDLDEQDLPNLLAEGVFVNDGDDESTEYDYEQQLEFGPGDDASVTYLKDRDYVDEDNPYLMLYSPEGSGNYFMKYTLDFTKNAESDISASSSGCGTQYELCDFEDTKIEMLGTEYDVTKAEYNGGVLTWEMMGGVTLNSMYEGETKTFTVSGVDYEVTVDIISDTGSDESVILTVNGESTKELFKDQTATVAGIELGIKQVMGNEAGEAGAGRDLVQFYLGAEKVVLTDDDVAADWTSDCTEVTVGGDTVDNLCVDWTASESSSVLTVQKMELIWFPENNIFETEEVDTVFPGPGEFDVSFEGMTSSGDEETVIFEAHGDENIQLTVPIEAGETTFDVLVSNGTTGNMGWAGFGESTTAGDGVLHVENGTVTAGDYILLSNEDERETRLVLLDDVSTDNVTTLEDYTTGTEYEKSCGASACTINVGDLSVRFDSVDSSGSETAELAANDVSAKIYTKEGLTIDLGSSPSGTTHDFTVTEEDENGALGLGGSFTVEAGFTGDDAHVSDVTDVDAFETAPGASNWYWEEGDSELYSGYSKFGTKVLWDQSGDQHSVELVYPGAESHANVFVKAESAVVTEGGGSGTYDEVQRIEVGAAVLDTEVSDLEAQNTIVVGGPCVNTLAAELMGNPADCTEGFEMGTAMVKLFQHDDDNVALLVAGYNAMDTRRASRVVANHGEYENFENMEVEVTGTSLTEISVSAPSEEPEEPTGDEDNTTE